MDTETGEILKFDSEKELEKAKGVRKLVELRGMPNKGCRHCYGRGYVGQNTITGEYIVCKCVRKKGKPKDRKDK